MTEQNSPPAAASSKPETPKGARAVCSIAVDAITVPSERLRKLRPEVVDWLVESITARSLLEPIIVRRRGAGYELIAGHHRFEAARNCSHQTIRAEVYDSLSDDEAELIQIDENLIRANLSDAERILHVARRKQLYEKLHPETKHGGDRRSAGARSSSQNENLKAFVTDIAVKTGKGRSTVARDVTRAKKVAVLDDIAGTCLDKGDEIDALGKLPEGEQRKLATAARAGEKVSAKARKPRQKDADTAVRTTTAEVDADPAASTERRKRGYAADEPEPKYRRLLDEPVTMTLGLIGPGGRAALTPMWFDYEGEKVLVDTASHRPKCEWIRKDPRLTILLVNPKNAYHWVQIKCTVEKELREWEPGGEYVTKQLDRIWHKYTGQSGHYGLRDPKIDEKRVLFVCRIDRIATFREP